METCQSQAQPAPRPQSSNARPANENNNNITINLPQQQFPQACGDNVKAITLQPQPIQLHVDTPTDWPQVVASIAVGLASAFVAYKVAAISREGQRNQTRAYQAEFRKDWQKEFKELIGKFISISARIKFELDLNEGYLKSPESNQLYCDFIEYKVRIDLMLDRSDSKFNEVIRISDILVNSVEERKFDKMGSAISELIVESNKIVEKAWQDIRSDIGKD